MTVTAAGSKPIQLQTIAGDKSMPYASDRQRRFFNANRKKIGGKTVDEFNESSKGMKLPESAPKKSDRPGKRIFAKKAK
jgi:hypothetical protein